MSKSMVFKTWEEITFSDGTKSWHCIGYQSRPHLVPVKTTKASYFYVKSNGQRVKVSRTDKGFYHAEGRYIEKA